MQHFDFLFSIYQIQNEKTVHVYTRTRKKPVLRSLILYVAFSFVIIFIRYSYNIHALCAFC